MRLSSVTLAALLTTASSFTFTFTFTSTVNRNPSIVATSSSTSSSRLQSSSGSDQGWNNDNFLDALGSGAGSDALNNANEQYYRESENRAAFRDQRLSAMNAMNAPPSPNQSQNQPQPDAVFGGTVEGFEQEAPKFDVSKRDEENPMGGELFRSMMERAKQKQGNVGGGNVGGVPVSVPVPPQSQLDPAAPPPPPAVPVSVPQPVVPQPQVPQQAVPAPSVTATPAATVTTPEQMAVQMQIYQQQVQVWQQQMNAYAQFSASDPQAAAQMQLNMPPPPTPPTFGAVPSGAVANVNVDQPVAPAAPVQVPQPQQQQTPPQNNNYNNENQLQQQLDPKEYLPKGSGNKDAYEINNPADVYLAQLKRDSTVRTEARKRGDLQTANTPFGDEGVKAIGNILSPELIATRRKQIAHNGGEFETSRDEMIIPYAEEEDTAESSYTGVSYREKLMEMQNKKRRQQQG